MNKALLLSLAAATLLGTNLNAQSMLQRFEQMEKEMNALKAELSTIKEKKISIKKEVDDDSQEVEGDDDDEGDESADGTENDAVELATNEERIEELEESVSDITRATSGSHLKFKVDYRFAVENMDYTMADGSEAKNNAFMTNRLWINMGYKATNNLSFSGQIAYNKAFGERSGASNPTNSSFETFDWVTNENAYDSTLRIRSAYFFYKDTDFFGLDMPWTFSIGRRPSTNGHLINYRDDDKASSPLGHAINVEFDGLSSKFVLNKETGTYLKVCAGRGMSNAAPKFSSTPYAKVTNDNTNIDLMGFIFTPYDDKQYALYTMYYYANNLIDVKNPADYTQGFDTVGGLHSFTASFQVTGIGDEINDFLDDTLIFASFATTKTDPKAGKAMLGSAVDESVTGTSYWVGTQFPSLLSEDGKWGLEYNHGSKYWRAITYAEDTNIGSKLATRGSAYEAYMTEYLVEDILSIQLRYTYIDYDYTGSNGFFGNTSGYSMSIKDAVASGIGAQIVDKAQDIRFYIRYRY